MKINELKKVLPFMLKHNIVPFIWGMQGVGKTQGIKQYCKENNLGLVVLNTATQEVGDLIGLLIKDDENKTVKHARPSWFPTEGEGIVFLDELNRASGEVIQALFPFVISGTLHTHQLPSGWKVVAAGNYQSDKFTTTDTSDAAWLSRFCHLDFTPTVEEWIYHAETNNGATDVADFIRQYPSMLELDAKQGGRLDKSMITPDRRAWLEGINKLEREMDFQNLDGSTIYEVYCGLIGESAAASFTTWKIKHEKTLTLQQILTSYSTPAVRSRVTDNVSAVPEKGAKRKKGEAAEVRFDLFNQPLEELYVKLEQNPSYLSANNFLEHLKSYLVDIPRELSMKCFVRFAALGAFHGKQELLNDPAYVAKFR